MSISLPPFVLIVADMVFEVPIAVVGALALGSKGLAGSYPEMAKISTPILVFGTDTVIPIEGFERTWLATAYHSDSIPPNASATSARLVHVRPWLLVTIAVPVVLSSTCKMTRS